MKQRPWLLLAMCATMPLYASCFNVFVSRQIPLPFRSAGAADLLLSLRPSIRCPHAIRSWSRGVSRTAVQCVSKKAEEEMSKGRRAALALTFAPLLTVVTMYAGVPLILNKGTRNQGWYKENFAGAMEGMDEYEAGIAGVKRDLFSVIAPTDCVVDFGAGLAPNIKYLPPNITYTAVEPNLFMHKSIESKTGVLAKKSQILTSISEIEPASQDIVISTLVLCSVEDQTAAIGEIYRVLKPGGMLLFLEHVAAVDQGYPAPYNIDKFDWKKAAYLWAQQAMTPLQVALADGCHPARETVREITETFTEVFYKRFDVPYLWGNDDWFNMFPIGPQVAGIAVKGKSKNAGVYAEVQFKFCAPLKEPLSAEPNGDSARQQRWQESGEAGKALEAASKGIKCQ